MFNFFKRRSNTMERRIQRGVKVLDRYDLEWFNNIDLDRLSLSSNVRCVAAQATGFTYGYACHALGIDHGRDYGFIRTSAETPGELHDAWVKVIRDKQNNYLAAMAANGARG